MGADATLDRLDRWERKLDRAIAFVPYVALAMSTALAVLVGSYVPGGVVLPRTLALSAAAASWIFFFVTRHPEWQSRQVLMVVYFAGLLALVAALVVSSPIYGFFAFTGYLHAVYALRRRLLVVGVGATAVIISLSQIGGVATLSSPAGVLSYLLVMSFNLGVAGAMSFVAWISQEQAVRRKQTIAELADANTRLEAALAENAGLHAQLLTQAREAGVHDERQRMAGEIHDTLAQDLTGIVTQLEAAEQAGRRTGEPAGDWRRHVRTAAQLARDGLTEARRSVQALRPQPLDGVRLPDALAEVVRRWSERHGVAAELVTTGTTQPLVPEIEATLLRTAQESLANVAKHAGASRVALTLSYMEDLVTLDVRDDGIGFDPEQVPARSAQGGFGLTGMRERVRRVAGSLELESEPGGGTAISACVPAIVVAAA